MFDKITCPRPVKNRINCATRITASIVGGYAGFLGAAHGGFEILQGAVAPGGVGISAIGAPCQADVMWPACLPAMTILPNFLVTGIFTTLIALLALVWVVVFVERKHGGWILILLSILMLLFGGGFIPVFTGIIAGVAATGIRAPLSFFRTYLSRRVLHFLAVAWPWAVTIFLVWSLGGWVLGYFFNQLMINLSFVLFFVCDLGLPLLVVVSGFARDIYNHQLAVEV